MIYRRAVALGPDLALVAADSAPCSLAQPGGECHHLHRGPGLTLIHAQFQGIYIQSREKYHRTDTYNRYTHAHIHTHTYMPQAVYVYIYMYIYIYVYTTRVNPNLLNRKSSNVTRQKLLLHRLVTTVGTPSRQTLAGG